MKIIQNIFSFLIALILIVLTITLSLYSFGLLSANFIPDLISSSYNSWQAAVVYLVFLLMALFVIYPYFTDRKFKSTRLLSSESGDITITISALSNLIKDRVREKEKFDDIKVKLEEQEEGLKIVLSGKLTVPGDLPAISENIQHDLKSYIKQTTGIQVAKVQIRIDDVKKENKLPEKVE
ncbi:cell envelope-related Asp23 family protein [Halanaerobium saccharolyticum]|uniref:Cell envelope-related Asp23 family protein n=1 Tax=Halanaerobium saccharolyticum TaxID=43595 RepID=A0A4R7ZA45_9FIRM|nr:alkaline shock response membrane anchor protein AmaP [Halanaerobium saccharolyticum]RAK11054.1 cell envelope-related Asp23 family protein [Halanaerobium saccharolyticum]TDW06905.1 cell envelope-related Asp23 family protein [Halanaerobium saccharolyticum]TDX63670.1 cell envelope-related Asp23 family protein [Halanaerobium saccharolyticum]